MSLHQAIVWIEETEAHILRVNMRLQHELTIAAPQPNGHAEHTTRPAEPANLQHDAYFMQVARALDTADEILVVGPSATKLDFVKYMHKSDHAYDARILGVETLDSPNDSRLEGYARLYFSEGGPRRSGNGSGFKES